MQDANRRDHLTRRDLTSIAIKPRTDKTIESYRKNGANASIIIGTIARVLFRRNSKYAPRFGATVTALCNYSRENFSKERVEHREIIEILRTRRFLFSVFRESSSRKKLLHIRKLPLELSIPPLWRLTMSPAG